MVIPFGIEAEKREPKPILAPGRAVAASGITAGFREHGNDIKPKADGPSFFGLLDFYRNVEALVPEFYLKLRFAICDRIEGLLFKFSERFVRHRIGCFGCDIFRRAILVDGLNNHGLTILFRGQINFWRENFNVRQFGRLFRGNTQDADENKNHG